MAQRRVPHLAFEYLEGGAEDEATLRRNRSAFDAWGLLPRTLVDTRERHLRGELFGRPTGAPLLIAPTGFNGMLDPDGDVALARAAARFHIPFTLSTYSTTLLEDVVTRAGGRLWMQLYVMKDRAIARHLVRRAAAAGYEALVFTSDANVFGSREWDRRNFRVPGRPTLRAAMDTLRHPRWLAALARSGGLPRLRNLESVLPRTATSALGGSTLIPQLMDASISWDDVAWMRDAWPGKLLVKGILDPSDAERAVAVGCDGIVLSNHGGRQLDSCVAPIEVLPQIAAAVGHRLTLIVDSGFRRGTDIVKGLALGAKAVMIGRATLYGLAAGGEAGVERALAILTAETDKVLGQLGCRSVSELAPPLLQKRAP
ncbi:MAG: alpha-hydroxy-acid oxidizing protein [Proteobacteria bacterium]|nr:alpha-hydroxy-acid oxidizing protein [Pseudomonadota bacterium]